MKYIVLKKVLNLKRKESSTAYSVHTDKYTSIVLPLEGYKVSKFQNYFDIIPACPREILYACRQLCGAIAIAVHWANY